MPRIAGLLTIWKYCLNERELLTDMRWLVRLRSGRIGGIFVFFAQTAQVFQLTEL